MVVVLAGTFSHPDGADGLLARFGAVSKLRGIRYWSASDKAWRTLITDAFALDGPESRRRRPDFSVVELAQARDVYFAQRDSSFSDTVVYGMRASNDRPDRIAVQMDNVSTIWLYGMPLFAPGELRSVHFLDRLGPQRWGYYALTSAGARAAGHEESFVNRAVAFYRHVIGVPTDRDPPVTSRS